MKFRTKYTDRVRKYIEPGSGIKKEYTLQVKDNEMTLVETGQMDLYAYIQSHKDSVDIHKILERCAMLDDYSMLNRMPAQFMDVTEMPKTLSEAFEMTKNAENMFMRFPTDLKEKYNNNFLEFLADLGSDHFNDNVRSFLDSIKEESVIPEVKEGE